MKMRSLFVIALLALPYQAHAQGNTLGPEQFAINVHNGGAWAAHREMPYLRMFKPGIEWVRTGPIIPSVAPTELAFFDATPEDTYLTDMLALFGGNRVLVVVDDGVDEGEYAKPTPENMAHKLWSILTTFPEVRHVQFMNEPLNFSKVTPMEYVWRYLPRARRVVDEINRLRPPDQQVLLWGAPWLGNDSGVVQTWRMVEAGALRYIDVLSAHIYADNMEDALARAREYKAMSYGLPVAITETNWMASGTSDYTQHGFWVREVMPRMGQIIREGVPPELQYLNMLVFYTLAADEQRQFNIIKFPNQNSLRGLYWEPTSEAHVIINIRTRAAELEDGNERVDPPRLSPPPRLLTRPGPVPQSIQDSTAIQTRRRVVPR